MSNKKLILLLIGLAVVATVVIVAIRLKRSDKSVADYVVPKLELAQMQVTNLTSERADMNMNMVVNNPAPIGLNIDSLHYIIYIEDNEVARSTYTDSLKIKANDKTNVTLPLTLHYDKLESVLDNLEKQGKDSVVYRVNATVFNDIIPKDKMNLKVEKRLPLVRIPEIKITDLKVRNLKFSGATLYVDALVKNENVFPIGFKDMAYSVQIEDNESVEGHKPGTVNIPAKGSETITIPAELSFKEMGKNLFDMIKKGDDVRYNFNMQTELVSDAQVLENSEIKLNASGKLKTVVDAVKENVKEEKQEKK